jgi:hypothetical protein
MMLSVSVIQQAGSCAGESTDTSSFSSSGQGAYRSAASGANSDALSGLHVPSVLDVLVIRPIMCHSRDRLNSCK